MTMTSEKFCCRHVGGVKLNKLYRDYKHIWEVIDSKSVDSCEMPSFCLVVGCSNNKKKNLELCFCRVPKIITNQGEETEILSTERRTRWLAAISRADLTETESTL